MPSSKTTLIQIIGRALRLHPDKKIANIILPYSLESDQSSINNFLKIMARNDSRIKKSYEYKILSGYISLDKINDSSDNENNNESNSDVEFKYEMVYNNMGVLQNHHKMFNYKKDLLFEYSNNNKKAPTNRKIIYKNVNIGRFLENEKPKIIDTNTELYKIFASNEYVKLSIDKYLDAKENKLTRDEWIELFFEYCDNNKRVPPSRSTYKNKALAKWYNHDKDKIKNNKCEEYKKLSENKYAKMDLDNYLDKKNKKLKKLTEKEWTKLLFQFCNEYKIIPKSLKQYKDHNLGQWYMSTRSKIIKGNINMYTSLSRNKYVKYNLDNLLRNKTANNANMEEWIKLLFEYCDEFKQSPMYNTIYKNYRLGEWLNRQKNKMTKGCKTYN